MVSRADVIGAYRLFLDREPESEQVVEDHILHPTIQDLHRTFLNSDEFKARSEISFKPFDWPPITVQVETSGPELQAMFDMVNRQWTQLGQEDPYFSVIGDPNYRGTEVSDELRDTFYETGRYEMDRLISFLARSGIALTPDMTCFELGCGLGRVTRWLAEHFRQVQAADISGAHLAMAEQALRRAGVSNVTLIRLANIETIRTIRNFDVFFSVIVLQHNPPPVMAAILRSILENLNPGGVGYFQLQTYGLDYEFRVDSYLAEHTEGPVIEMHVLPQEAVLDIIYDTGCKLLEVREDGQGGATNGISQTFVVRKAGVARKAGGVGKTH
ncbi:MAG: class I SAM-dependent methyltransferase [Acidisphaera sp.]|nr:class I SAM-dependent methyltransferase [Acidisphaera sp.]